MTTYAQFVERVARVKAVETEWRWGQTYWNALYVINPRLANYLHESRIDPYYDDAVIQQFLTMVWGYCTAFGGLEDDREHRRRYF